MSYRPITDVWTLARSKTKFFGAYPAGFLIRARALLGVGREDCVLHVCSGRVRDYKCGPGCKGSGLDKHGSHYHGLGKYDVTMDLWPETGPDFYMDASEAESYKFAVEQTTHQIRAVLADPPYTREFAKEYEPGPERFVTGDQIVKHSIAILPVGGRVGVLSLGWPRYPKATARQVAIVGVLVGNGNLGRWFAVYERTA